jgi:hypothetical protein
MEKSEANALLGTTSNASAVEVEDAYRKRAGEVRKRFEAERDLSLRRQYRREFDALQEARDSLLSKLDAAS